MRFFWSAVLMGALMFEGFDLWESRHADRFGTQQRIDAQTKTHPATAEDGTGFPPK